jgi:hypothetical protein
MKLFATIIATLSVMLMLVPSSASAADFQYGWTISNSNASPFSNSGAPQGGGLLTLYLWLECVTKDGVASAEFDLAVGAPNNILAFTAMNGFLNAGGATNLLLAATGCPGDGDPAVPIVAGSILALDFGGEYCIVNSATNNRNVSVDCSQTDPQTHPNKTTGYSSLGGPPACDDRDINDMLCVPTSVDASSWGQVKGLYR